MLRKGLPQPEAAERVNASWQYSSETNYIPGYAAVSYASGVWNSSPSSRLRDSFVLCILLWGTHTVLGTAKGRQKVIIIFQHKLFGVTSNEEVENQ